MIMPNSADNSERDVMSDSLSQSPCVRRNQCKVMLE